MMAFEMEAEIRLRSNNGIPIPDKLYFYAGGFTPGINVDGMGVFWIKGAGGGIDNLFETIYPSHPYRYNASAKRTIRFV